MDTTRYGAETSIRRPDPGRWPAWEGGQAVLGFLDICRLHFAYDFHPIRPLLEVIIREHIARETSRTGHNHAARLLATGTGENRAAATRLLVDDASAPTELLEECLETQDPVLRLELIFRLRQRGGIYFDLEIEEYILTRERLEAQLQMTATYRRETGRGWSIFPELFRQHRRPEERQAILCAAAAAGMPELIPLLRREIAEGPQRTLALAWLRDPAALEELARQAREAWTEGRGSEWMSTALELIAQIADRARTLPNEIVLALLAPLGKIEPDTATWWSEMVERISVLPGRAVVDRLALLLPDTAAIWLQALRARAAERSWSLPPTEDLAALPGWVRLGLASLAAWNPPAEGQDGLTELWRDEEGQLRILEKLLLLQRVRGGIRPPSRLRQRFRQWLREGNGSPDLALPLGIACARLLEAGEFSPAERDALLRMSRMAV